MTTEYLVMTLHRWDNCRLKGLPCGMFTGIDNDSIGFMAVFDDLDKLKDAYPDGVDIMRIEKDGDRND